MAKLLLAMLLSGVLFVTGCASENQSELSYRGDPGGSYGTETQNATVFDKSDADPTERNREAEINQQQADEAQIRQQNGK